MKTESQTTKSINAIKDNKVKVTPTNWSKGEKLETVKIATDEWLNKQGQQ